MNYYYEIKLNFDDKDYLFYEMSKNDKYEFIKKIPIIKVKSDVFKSICLYNFKINKETYDFILNKTICKDNKNLCNACIFCDTKNTIAIEFSDDAKSIARSNLLLEDENNICEVSYSLKYRDIRIEKLNKLIKSDEFKQESNIKKIIRLEIQSLYKEKNIDKLKYLYYEWFSKTEDNIAVIKKEMLDDLKEHLNHTHFNIYQIIRLSYNKAI